MANNESIIKNATVIELLSTVNALRKKTKIQKERIIHQIISLPFIWSPALFWIVLGLVFLIYNVQLIDDNFYQRSTEISIYRFMIHRTSFAFTILHCILLLINTTSNKVFKSLLLCRNTGNLQWFTRVGSVTLIIITLFFGTPDWFIQTYASIIAPILGIMWLVYQGYIILTSYY